MNARRRWQEVRYRFWLLLGLCCFAAAMVAGRTPRWHAERVSTMTPDERVEWRLNRVSSEWFGKQGPSGLLFLAAVFLTAGGPLAERGRGSTLLTLSLPTTRRRILLGQFGMSVLLVLVMALAGALSATVASGARGAWYPAGPALAGALVQTASIVPFVAVMLLLQALLRSAIAAAVTSLGVILIAPNLLSELLPQGSPMQRVLEALEFPPVMGLAPAGGLHHVTGSGLLAVIPWMPLAVVLSVGLALFLSAIAVFDRIEP